MIIRPKFFDKLSPKLRNILDGCRRKDSLGFQYEFNRYSLAMRRPNRASEHSMPPSSISVTNSEQFSDHIQEFNKSQGSRPDLLVSHVKEFLLSLSFIQILQKFRALMLYRMPIHQTLVEFLSSINVDLLHLIQCSQIFYDNGSFNTSLGVFPLPKSKRLYVHLNPSHLWRIGIHAETEAATITFSDSLGQFKSVYSVDAGHCTLLKHL